MSRLDTHALKLCAAGLLLGLLLNRVFAAECIPCDRANNQGFMPSMNGLPGDFAQRRSGIDVDAKWRLGVSRDGWYRLTQPQLVAAGLASNLLIGSEIRMYCRTQEVALLVTSSNLLSPQDSIYFYGVQHDGYYSRTNVYWLGLGGAGRRIQTMSADPVGVEPVVSSVCFSAVYNPKALHRPYHQPLDDGIDHWFAALVNDSSGFSFMLNTSNRVHNETANVTIHMYGLTTSQAISPDHRTRVRINGVQVGLFDYDGPDGYVTNFVVTNNVFSQGMSTNDLLQMKPAGISNESAYLISYRLDYIATNTMRNPSHEFCSLPGTNTYRVLNLTTNGGFWVMDISDPYAPVLLSGATITNATTLAFRYGSSGVARLAVVQSNGVLQAATPEEFAFRNLSDTTRSADYILITPVAFRDYAYRLAKHRYTNGLRVAVAPLNDVYNEFGYGIIDADSIKQFIGYAYHHWTAPQPRFALLIGEGTYDPLGYLQAPPAIQIPVKFGSTPFVYAAQDVWYGFVDGMTNAGNDALADVVIGRISISSNTPLTNLVNKIQAYEGGSTNKTALLVADTYDAVGGNDFLGSSTTNIAPYLLSNGYQVAYADAAHPGTLSAAFISSSMNSGRRLVSYVGHGALDRWSTSLYTISNVASLANSIYPLVTIFSCQNGSFVESITNGLSEAFIELPRGSSSVFSPSALSVQVFADKVEAGFMKSIAADNRRYLGDVAMDAYLNLWMFNPNAYELLTYQVLGDPALIVNKPGTLPP